MKKSISNSSDKFNFIELENIIKNSPSLQKHLEESKKIFDRIPKDQLEKLLIN